MYDPILLIKKNLNNIIKDFHIKQKKEINIEMLDDDLKNELLFIAHNLIEEHVPFEENINMKNLNCLIESMVDTTFGLREHKMINNPINFKKAIQLILLFYQAFYENHYNNLKKRYEESENKLLRSVVAAQEKERKKMAIVLHDDIAQSLAAILFRVHMIRNIIDEENKDIKQEIFEIEELIRKIIKKCRLVSFDMDSFWLEKAGFIPTVQAYIRDFENEHHIEVYLEAEDFSSSISRFTFIHLFRVIQEALRNIQKHSGATKVVISLSIIDNNRILLSVKDNGRGFNKEEDNSKENYNVNQFGLISIEQRTKLLKGSFSIKTVPGLGTTLIVDIPIESISFAENNRRKASPWIRSV